jgi:hypothetical protein
MKIPSSEPVPGWLWCGTLAGVMLVVMVVAVGAILLARGAADPPVAGPVVWQDANLAWAGGPQHTILAGDGAWLAAPPPARLPGDAFTLAVRARLCAESDPGAAWGVWLAAGDGARMVYAISGDGLVTTRRCPVPAPRDINACPAARPEWRWMPYPRLALPGASNTIALHREPYGAVRLRLNDEKLGAAPVAVTGEWGVWVGGGRADRAILTWESAELRAPMPD